MTGTCLNYSITLSEVYILIKKQNSTMRESGRRRDLDTSERGTTATQRVAGLPLVVARFTRKRAGDGIRTRGLLLGRETF